ncbi:MAG: glycosyltransferase [Methylocystis sp.]
MTPILPEGLCKEKAHSALRGVVNELIADVQPSRWVTWYYTPMALEFTRHLQPDVRVYDNMDELSAFAGAPQGLLDLERELIAKSDLIFVGGQSLYEAKRDRHDSIHVFPSSVDASHFRVARQRAADPDDQRRIPHPRIGFFGVIDERMDLDIVAGVAALRPQWQLVMLGPTAKISPHSLPRAANIHWLGCKHYQELPSYLSGWDVGIMPFALNDATRFISPTKTPEFLAAGVPVVSTAIADVVNPYGDAGHVEIASNPEEFVAKIELLLSRPKASWLNSVDERLAEMSWDKTWARMMLHMAGVGGRSNAAREAQLV